LPRFRRSGQTRAAQQPRARQARQEGHRARRGQGQGQRRQGRCRSRTGRRVRMPGASSRKLLMGRIGAAHGIKGVVRITSFTGEPLALKDYGPLATDKPGLVVEIVSARATTNVLVARLKGVNDRDAAEKLNGVELYVERDKLPPPGDDDDFYQADLIGLEARLSDGTVLGTVTAIPNYGASDLIE